MNSFFRNVMLTTVASLAVVDKIITGLEVDGDAIAADEKGGCAGLASTTVSLSKPPIGTCAYGAIFPGHDVLDLHLVQVTALVEDRVPGATVWVYVLVPIGGIDAVEFFLVGDDFARAFENNRIIAISGMDNNPGLVGEIFCLLHIAASDKVDACAIPDKPHGNGMWSSIWPGSTDPDGALRSEW